VGVVPAAEVVQPAGLQAVSEFDHVVDDAVVVDHHLGLEALGWQRQRVGDDDGAGIGHVRSTHEQPHHFHRLAAPTDTLVHALLAVSHHLQDRGGADLHVLQILGVLSVAHPRFPIYMKFFHDSM